MSAVFLLSGTKEEVTRALPAQKHFHIILNAQVSLLAVTLSVTLHLLTFSVHDSATTTDDDWGNRIP